MFRLQGGRNPTGISRVHIVARSDGGIDRVKQIGRQGYVVGEEELVKLFRGSRPQQDGRNVRMLQTSGQAHLRQGQSRFAGKGDELFNQRQLAFVIRFDEGVAAGCARFLRHGLPDAVFPGQPATV
ncbi:hypothetical protein [Breoghania sp.]|uniref:hypothetical protein n=1 Tax=Breoghania sp. TaxID=2065378 RepID=UPI002615B6C0|nr:hypothetical protein [Breoghania sp.]MDJ0933086.1 hypothetical protein [Breoghania sp.]